MRGTPPITAHTNHPLIITLPIAGDEVFNYWEPVHYLVYGEGLQTWEYSPTYAIRSWAYCALHAAVAFAASLLTSDKVMIFHIVRGMLGVLSALSETLFVRRAAHAAGDEVGWLTYFLLLTSAGMFHSSVAFLPSSFAMLLLTCASSFWMGPPRPSPTCAPDYARAIWCVAAAFYLGWPFVVVAAAPLAIDAIVSFGFLACVKTGLKATVALVIPSAILDSYMYGRPVLAFLNILLYNSSAEDGAGAQLYGVEPWHFYLHNLALNHNAALPAALIAPLLLALPLRQPSGVSAATTKKSDDTSPAAPRDADDEGAMRNGRLLLTLSGLYLWMAFFSAVPHKEERFMFPVYPLLLLAAAISMSIAARALTRALGLGRTTRRGLLAAMVITCAAISAMRSSGQARYYGAPLSLYSDLARHSALPDSATATPAPPAVGAPSVVCVGNEWYRFPSSFFLPPKSHLAFVKDGFTGQLPAHFSAGWPAGSRAVHTHFNGLNKEETERYVPLHTCDVLVDLLPAIGAADEKARRALHKGRVAWRTRPFLDAARSPVWSRALYVPGLSAKRNAYAEYALLVPA